MWTKLGDMVQKRRSHGAIQISSESFLVVGGYGSLKTEVCTMENQFITCTAHPPELSYYQYYPELSFVEEGFCQ